MCHHRRENLQCLVLVMTMALTLFVAVTSTTTLNLPRAVPAVPARAVPPRMSADESSDFALLSRRIDELRAVHFMEGIILTEPLLPRQTLRLDAMPEAFAELVRECHASNRTIGIIGGDTNGEPLNRGVEATIAELTRECNDAGYGDPFVYSAVFTGERIFELVKADDALPVFKFACDVRFLDLGLSDQISAAQSPSRVVELASRELTVLVRQWEELARGGGVTLWGKPRNAASAAASAPASAPATAAATDGELDADAAAVDAAVTSLLESLGSLPGLESPSERALWVAALITAGRAGGQPAMAAVRPSILTATTYTHSGAQTRGPATRSLRSPLYSLPLARHVPACHYSLLATTPCLPLRARHVPSRL